MRTKGPNTLFIAAPKLNQLNLLKELALDPHLTQAELARRCDLSVSMVNNYMKEFCTLGWLQYHRKTTKTVSYHVTAAGDSRLKSVQHELINEVADLVARAKERILAVILESTHERPRRVILYGSGVLAEMTFHALESAGIAVVGICDDDPAKLGDDWLGREILNPLQIRFLDPDAVIFASEGGSTACDVEGTLRHIEERGIDLVRLGRATGQGVSPGLAAEDRLQSLTIG